MANSTSLAAPTGAQKMIGATTTFKFPDMWMKWLCPMVKAIWYRLCLHVPSPQACQDLLFVIHFFLSLFTYIYLAFTHIYNGSILTDCEMVQHKCSTNMIIYVPIDVEVKYALVIVENPHSHPAPPLHKTSHAGEVAIQQAIAAADPAGLNVTHLLTGK
jgi:hypothetical protein